MHSNFKKYHGKKDAAITILYLVIITGLVIGLYELFASNHHIIVLEPLIIGFIVVSLWIFIHTAYYIGNNIIHIHFGPFYHRVQIKEIVNVSIVTNYKLNYALGLKKVAIKYYDPKDQLKMVYVLPKQQDEFIKVVQRMGEKKNGR